MDGQRRAREQRRRDEERRGRGDVAGDEHLGQPERSAGATRDRARASRVTFAPAAASISSVWSRVGAGSSTVVCPLAPSPASRIADFTCALATGSSYSIPCSSRALDRERQPAVRSPSSDGAHARRAARRRAPSAGRESDSSPTSSKRPAWKARMPADAAGRACRRCRSRSARPAAASPRRPTPCTTSVSTSSSSTSTPSARTARERRLGVARAAPARDARLALGERADQQRAVRDRLVAGDADVAVDPGGRLDPHRAPPRRRRRSPGLRAARRRGAPRPRP